MRDLLFLTLLGCGSSTPEMTAAPEPADEPATFEVVYTGHGEGEIEPCG